MEKHIIQQEMLHYCGKFIIKILVYISVLIYTCSAQTNTPLNTPKYIEEVDTYFDNGDYYNALKFYLNFYQIDSTDADVNYKIGVCMFNLKQYKGQEIKYLEKSAFKNNYEALFYLGQSYHLNSEFEKAIESYEKYLSFQGLKENTIPEVNRLIEISKNAIELTKNPINVEIQNIGADINSAYPDYSPLISADEKKLIFTSRRPESTGGMQDINADYFEDIFISNKITSFNWSKPYSISPNINTVSHDACVALAPSGEKLIVYRTNKDITGGDLYISIFNGTDWSVPELFGPDINISNQWQGSACFTADESTIYISSNKNGGWGGKDLYRITKLPNGKWSKPLNLGATINTALDEDAPFIHPDGKTLYFSSKAHKNMGGYDIFKCNLQEDGFWSKPENIGYPINTVDDDIYFVLTTNGKTGYYSSSDKKNSLGGTDIYSIQFPVAQKDLVVLKGNIRSSQTNSTLKATVNVIDVETNQQYGTYTSNPLTGNFLLILSSDKKYILSVKLNGFNEYTQLLSTKLVKEEEPITILLDKK